MKTKMKTIKDNLYEILSIVLFAIVFMLLALKFNNCDNNPSSIPAVIEKDADETKKVVQELQDQIDALLKEVENKNREIQSIREENAELRRRKNEQIEEVRRYSNRELDDFFDRRGL